MQSPIRGVTLDSSILIAAERRDIDPVQAVSTVRALAGNIPVVLCSVTVVEFGHGIYRALTEQVRSRRRRFLDVMKDHVPVVPVTDATAEIAARIGGEQAAKGINIPIADLMIGACALELGYAIATGNLRDFRRIPDLTIIQL